MKRLFTLALALTVFAAPYGCEEKKPEDEAPVAVCVSLQSEPDSVDPAFAYTADSSTLVLQAFSGLAGYRLNSSGVRELYAECAKELVSGTVGEDNRVTYVYTLRDGLKWSDGSVLTAHDFVYAWNRAASGLTCSDTRYFFDVIDGYEEMNARDDSGQLLNPDAALNVSASTDGSVLTVVLSSPCPTFEKLLALPAFMPVKREAVENDVGKWPSTPASYVTNGAYIMTALSPGASIVYKKNPHYYNTDSISIDVITFIFSYDVKEALDEYKKGTVHFVEAPTAEGAELSDYADEIYTSSTLGAYYLVFNVNKGILPYSSSLTDAEKEIACCEVRRALSVLIADCDLSRGEEGLIPLYGITPSGITDTDTLSDFSAAVTDGDAEQAIQTLKKYYTYDTGTGRFTNFPTVEYFYNENDLNKRIAHNLQDAMQRYGITVTTKSERWDEFLTKRSVGDCVLFRDVWFADSDDPVSFFDRWTSENNDAGLGSGAHGEAACFSITLMMKTHGVDYSADNAKWGETYDLIIDMARGSADLNHRYALLHSAEELLLSTGAVVPICSYVDSYLCSKSLKGVFSSPSGSRYFTSAAVVS